MTLGLIIVFLLLVALSPVVLAFYRIKGEEDEELDSYINQE